MWTVQDTAKFAVLQFLYSKLYLKFFKNVTVGSFACKNKIKCVRIIYKPSADMKNQSDGFKANNIFFWGYSFEIPRRFYEKR